MPPEECRFCREGNRPPKGTKRRPTKKEKEEKEKEKLPDDFRSLNHGISPQPRAIMKDGAYYRDLIPGRNETRIEHLEHHIPGSSHDMTTPALAAQSGEKQPKSPSAFSNGTGFEGLLSNAQTFLNTADSDQVREYTHGGRLVRVTFIGDHDGLEVTLLDSLPGNTYGVATTYDNVTAAYVKTQPWYK